MNAHISVFDRELLVVLYPSLVPVSVPFWRSPSAVIARHQEVFRQFSGSHQEVVGQSSGTCLFCFSSLKNVLNLSYSRSLEKVCLALFFFNLRSYVNRLTQQSAANLWDDGLITVTKGQIISKWFMVSSISSKKRTKEFDFTTVTPQVDLFSFVFWRKSKTP